MNNKTKQLALCALFCALIIAGTFIKIPIPVVPFTLQFLFTTLAGLFLGKKLGAFCVLTYLIMGLIGIPIFAEGGGISYILKPSFGYLIGFVFGSYVTGWIAYGKSKLSYGRIALASFAGLAIVYLFGMTYYAIIANFYLGAPISFWDLILYCFLLAVPGDIFLCILSTVLAKKLVPMFKAKFNFE